MVTVSHIAPETAPEIAPTIAQTIAQKIAPEIAPGIAQQIAPEIAPGIAQKIAPGIAPGIAGIPVNFLVLLCAVLLVVIVSVDRPNPTLNPKPTQASALGLRAFWGAAQVLKCLWGIMSSRCPLQKSQNDKSRVERHKGELPEAELGVGT